MPTYDLYGVPAADLEEARVRIETALHLVLVPHESGYHGGAYYRFGSTGAEHFILQRNLDEHENEWAEPEFEQVQHLLYVNETDRAATLEQSIGGVATLLRRQEL